MNYINDNTGTRLFTSGISRYTGVSDPNYYLANEIAGGGIVFRNSSGNTFLFTSTGLLQFEGSGSAFPALKRSSTELQVRLADDSGYAPLQAAAGTFNGNLTVDTNVLFVDAVNNRVGIGTTDTTTYTDRLNVVGSSNASSRGGIYVRNTSINGNATFYFDNDRGNFAAYGGLLTGGSSNTNIFFGVTRQDKTFLISDGASSLGLGIGTLNAQPIYIGINNARVMTVTAGGLLAFGDGITSAYPALKRSSTELQVRLADDSDFTKVGIGGLGIKPTTFSSTATASAVNSSFYIFTGSSASQELDLPAGVSGLFYFIKNRGSVSFDIDPNGTEEIYTATALGAGVTLTVNPGEAYTLAWDGTYWVVM